MVDKETKKLMSLSLVLLLLIILVFYIASKNGIDLIKYNPIQYKNAILLKGQLKHIENIRNFLN